MNLDTVLDVPIDGLLQSNGASQRELRVVGAKTGNLCILAYRRDCGLENVPIDMIMTGPSNFEWTQFENATVRMYRENGFIHGTLTDPSFKDTRYFPSKCKSHYEGLFLPEETYQSLLSERNSKSILSFFDSSSFSSYRYGGRTPVLGGLMPHNLGNIFVSYALGGLKQINKLCYDDQDYMLQMQFVSSFVLMLNNWYPVPDAAHTALTIAGGLSFADSLFRCVAAKRHGVARGVLGYLQDSSQQV